MTARGAIADLDAFLLVGVTLEGARVRELAELVPDHLFTDEDFDETATVVDRKGQANKLWNDRACTAPSLDRRALAGTGLHCLRATVQLLVNNGAFLK